MAKDIWFFLDDEREPPNTDVHWVIFRTGEAMVSLINDMGRLPHGISFDHDLGDGCSGHDVAKQISNMFIDNALIMDSGFEFKVHSQNPVGAKNISATMHDLFRFQAMASAVGG